MPGASSAHLAVWFLAPLRCSALRPSADSADEAALEPKTGDFSLMLLKEHLDGVPFEPGILGGEAARRWAASLFSTSSASESTGITAHRRATALLEEAMEGSPGAAQFLAELPGDEKLKPGDWSSTRVEMPWDRGEEPLARCPSEGQAPPALEEEANLHEALAIFCRAGLQSLVEFYVDPAFKGTHDRLKDKNGWIDKAYLSYMGVEREHDSVSAQEDLLAQSVNHFSEYPLVVANFGHRLPVTMTPERYPNLIVMHARSTVGKPVSKSFNFNKFTSMLFTKVRSGLVLDADQFVSEGVDYLLKRAEEETTKAYPYPIMPVHWLSRDPEDSVMKPWPAGYIMYFKSKDAPARSMHWGHSHPTWTHFALPWLAKWTSFALAPERTNSPQWLKDQGWIEDEDLMNFGLWADNLTKQWCKFDIPYPDEYDAFVEQTSPGDPFLDAKFYPRGIPLMYFTAHAAKKPNETYNVLSTLWEAGDDKRKALYYDKKWFGSEKALRAYDPALKCIA